ncbi:MAG: S-methyl-5'-thioadenosine phosphorylase [Dehalococcoidia bacterium]|nr:S-methyl-5'-thioadenosine phosphorylase [Dehalococcoidia bacterium]
MVEAKIGVIGGSGLYQIEGLSDLKETKVETPFGDPSDLIMTGTLQGVPMAFLPRHGKGHRISPSELPVRANIFALKSLGVDRIISISAVGSLKEDIHPLDLVIPDQVIDRTKGRVSTFFGRGLVAHVGFAEPFCPHLSQILYQTAQKLGTTARLGGTCVVMEGPAFSTKAESRLYRSWGASIVGMTALPEAKLAREAEMCYATLAFVTDYDCWHESADPVTVEMVVANLMHNAETAKNILKASITGAAGERSCQCDTALKDAIITSREHIPANLKRELAPLIGKYVQ